MEMTRRGSRGKPATRVAKTTLSLSVELLERLDRYHKRISAGHWRRGEAPTKSQLIEEAIRTYLDRHEREL